MAIIEYNFGTDIPLMPMIPAVPGVPTNIPATIGATAGVYIILNQYPNPATPENRYMGITNNFQTRFRSRQGACFELGLENHVLTGVSAFLGTVRYQDNGALAWNTPGAYDATTVNITLDGQAYDFEHILIKAAQNIWPHGTATNTLKTAAPLVNLGAFPLDIRLTSPGVALQQIVIPVGGSIV